MKQILYVVVAATSSLLAAGCVSHPQDAEAFRQAVPGALSASMDEYEVERPFAQVAGTFAKKAPECLSVAVETTSQTSTSYQHYTTTYHPTVVKGAERVELHLQQHTDGAINVSKEPAGGYYMLVADAYPVEPEKTRVVVYRPAWGYKNLTKAIHGWASGENLGCPDLTKS